jgi:hypothetical protein
MMTRFHFTDLHSFKDYVIFAQTYLPDRFPRREGFSAEDQWTLDLAFKALRHGLDMAVQEKGDLPVFADCRRLVEEAYAEYFAGRMREGFFKLEEVNKLLKKVPSW